MKLNNRLVANTLLFLCLFPYVSFVDTAFDTQPWALFASIAFFVIFVINRGLRMPLSMWMILSSTTYSIVVYMIGSLVSSSAMLSEARSVATYLSIFSLMFVGYWTYKYISAKWFLVALVIWQGVLFLQIMVGVDITEFIVPRLSTSGYRGFTALAPEPSYYARVCLAFLVLNELFFHEKKYRAKTYFLVVLSLIVQLLFTYSATAVVFLIWFLIVKLAVVSFSSNKRGRIIYVAVIPLIGLALSSMLMLPGLSQSRAGAITSQLISEPAYVFLNDPSASARIRNPISGLHGFVSTYGVGTGLAKVLAGPETSGIDVNSRVSGGMTSALFELGVMGIPMVVVPLWILVSGLISIPNLRPAFIVSISVLIPLMFFEGSLAFPLFGYLLGAHLFLLRARHFNRINLSTCVER